MTRFVLSRGDINVELKLIHYFGLRSYGQYIIYNCMSYMFSGGLFGNWQ